MENKVIQLRTSTQATEATAPKVRGDALERVVSDFVSPPAKGRATRVAGHYRVSKDGSKLTHWSDYNQAETLIAVKVDGVVIGNASILPYVEASSAWGSYQTNRNQTRVQRLLEAAGAPMLPFTVFEQAGLDVATIKVVERAQSETIAVNVVEWDWSKEKNKVLRVEKRHFVGASVFKVGKSYFLFDLDRREIEHKIFNPFLVKLPHAVKTVAEAYQCLKPKEVVAAEKRGVKVLRQGEWFFIPSKAPKLKKPSDVAFLASIVGTLDDWQLKRLTKEQRAAYDRCRKFQNLVPMPKNLQAGENRPNEAQELVQVGKVTYVRGKVSHTGREHADMILKTWHVAVPNTATTSWTITGDID